MVLFVTMVVAAVAIATTATTGARHRQRAIRLLALLGVALWTAASAGLAMMSGVHPLLLGLVGVPLAYAVHDLTRRALTARANTGRASGRRPVAARLLAAALASNQREPLHWSVPAAVGTAATSLEAYWVYEHLTARGGAFSDLAALAGFTVLATLTVGLSGAGCLALHMRSTHRAEQVTNLPDQPGGGLLRLAVARVGSGAETAETAAENGTTSGRRSRPSAASNQRSVAR